MLHEQRAARLLMKSHPLYDEVAAGLPEEWKGKLEALSPSDALKEAIECIVARQSEGFQKFHLNIREFSFLLELSEETTNIIPTFRFFYKSGILVVELPRPAHEQGITSIRMEALEPILNLLPRTTPSTFRASFEPNTTLSSVIPDLFLKFQPRVYHPDAELRVLALVESAFTQDREDLESKIKHELDNFPHVFFVVMILVKEAHQYQSPQANSTAWKTFCDDKKVRSPNSFFSLRDHSDARMPQKFEFGPFRVANHIWSDISGVEYHVWVRKEDGPPIDLAQIPTTGSIYPEIDMDALEEKVREGMRLCLRAIVRLSRALDPDADTSQDTVLEKEFPDRVDWTAIQADFASAGPYTGYQRYTDWFRNLPSANEPGPSAPSSALWIGRLRSKSRVPSKRKLYIEQEDEEQEEEQEQKDRKEKGLCRT